MRNLTHKTTKKLRSKRGETLVETLISVVIFALFSLGIATTVQVSLRITADATEAEDTRIEKINSVVTTSDGDSAVITFFAPSMGINATHSISLYSQDGVIAFDPE